MKKLLLGVLFALIASDFVYADRSTAAANAIYAANVLESKGYTVRDIPGRHLRNNHYRTYNRYLYSGSCYAIVGVGDNNVRDLDVIIYDRNWNYVGRDSDSSKTSAVKICPRRSGTYRIRTKMYRGSGYFYQVIAWR